MVNRLIAALAFLLLPFAALGGTVSLTWVNPTTRTDGTALTDLTSLNVYRSTSAAGLATATKYASLAAPAQAYTDPTATDGTTYFYAITAVDSKGGESSQSNVASKLVPNAPPSPPTGLAVTAVTAYQAVPGANGDLVVSAIGTVPASTPCDPLHGVIVGGITYNEVPKSAVTFKGSIRYPDYARCS